MPSCFEVNSLVWTGERVNPAKYERRPREERMKGYRSVEFQNHQRPFELFATDCAPVCVEIFDSSEPLTTFEHPENAVYVFGPEDGYVPRVVKRRGQMWFWRTARCRARSPEKKPTLPWREMLRDVARRVPTSTMDDVGWDGKKT